MITLDMCLNYIQKHCKSPYFKNVPIELSPAQKKFLGNLCEGKLTDTPRCFGKTFVIDLYGKCLNYYTDSIKWGGAKADDYISLKEANEGFGELKPFSHKIVMQAYVMNKEKAMREYNFKEEDLEALWGE